MEKLTICGYTFDVPQSITESLADEWVAIQDKYKFNENQEAIRNLSAKADEVDAEVESHKDLVRIYENRLTKAVDSGEKAKIKSTRKDLEDARKELNLKLRERGVLSGQILEAQDPHLYELNAAYLEMAYKVSGSKEPLDDWRKVAGEKDYTEAITLIKKLYTPYFRNRPSAKAS